MRKCNLFFVLAFLSVVNVQFQTEPSGLFNIHDSLSWLIYSCLLKDCIILYLSTHSEEERHFGKPWVAQAFHYYINNSPLSSSYVDMTTVGLSLSRQANSKFWTVVSLIVVIGKVRLCHQRPYVRMQTCDIRTYRSPSHS